MHAAAAGTAARPRDPTGYGQVVYIDGDDGVYWYGHIDTWLVRPGAHIEAGQQIATVGNRDRVIAGPGGDGSHLHFQMHVGPGPE